MFAKVILLTLAILGAGYGLMLAWMSLRQRRIVFHPDPRRSHPGDCDLPEMVPVPVRTADGCTITGWYGAPRIRDRATVVIFHGNAGTIAGRAFKARLFLDAGYGVFLAEYRGYGGNPGQPSEAGLYADGRAVLHWLISRGVPASRLVLYGESLGSGVATQLAGEVGPQAVVLECPFTALADLAPPYIPPGLARMLMLDHFDNLAKIGGLAGPLLVVHGERDEVVPVAMARALLQAAREGAEGVFLPQGRHSDLWDHGAGPRILDFLARPAG